MDTEKTEVKKPEEVKNETLEKLISEAKWGLEYHARKMRENKQILKALTSLKETEK